MTISEMCGRDSKQYFACEFGYMKLMVLRIKQNSMCGLHLVDICIIFVRLTV